MVKPCLSRQFQHKGCDPHCSSIGVSVFLTKMVSKWLNSSRPSDAYIRQKPTIIGSDIGLSPGRRQAIIWTNAGIWLIRTLGTNFSEILNEIHAFSFRKTHLKMSSAKWRPFCLGLNVLSCGVIPSTFYTPFLYAGKQNGNASYGYNFYCLKSFHKYLRSCKTNSIQWMNTIQCNDCD